MTDPNTPPQSGDSQNDQPTTEDPTQPQPTQEYAAQGQSAQGQAAPSQPSQTPTQQYPGQPAQVPIQQYQGQQVPMQQIPGPQPQSSYATSGGAQPVGSQPIGAQQYGAQAPAGPPVKQVQSQPPGPARELGMGPSSRTAMRTIIGIVGALALILPVSAFAITGTGLSNLVREEATYDLPLTAESLAVDVDAASVFVTVGEEFDAPVVRTTHVGQRSQGMTPGITDVDGMTTIALERENQRDSWFPGSIREDSRVEIELPVDYARDLALDVSTRWGYTNVVGEFATVNATSETGALTFDVTADDVTAETGAGYIDVTGTMETLSMDSTTGWIETQRVNVAKEVTAHTRTGGMDLGLGEAAMPVDGITATAETGWLTVSLPRENRVRNMDVQGYDVDATSRNGMVSIDVDESRPGDGVIPIVVSASSGDVEIEYQSPQTVRGGDADEDDSADEDMDDEDSFDEEGAFDEEMDANDLTDEERAAGEVDDA